MPQARLNFLVIKVRDAMTRGVDTIDQKKNGLEAARAMRRKRRGCLVVVDGGKPVGIVTERDLVRKIVANNRDPEKIKILGVMSKPLLTIEAEASLRDAAQKMVQNRIRRLPVTEGGKLVGMLTTTDFVKELSEEGLWKEFEKAIIRAGEYGGYPYA